METTNINSGGKQRGKNENQWKNKVNRLDPWFPSDMNKI